MEDFGRDSASPAIGGGVIKGKSSVSPTGGAPFTAAPAPTAPPNLERRITSLSRALSRARIESAEHSGVLAELRGAEIARLEILREQMEPVLAQLPRDCELFDVAVSPGERPRLFIDQIGFVEMGADRRSYRFMQDTRHGRITICESDKPETLVEAITAYIAHRLIEREQALAVDYASGGVGAAGAARAAAWRETSAREGMGGNALKLRLTRMFLFLVELLGSVTFFGLLGLFAMWTYRRFIGN
jgi:hypothetical protein